MIHTAAFFVAKILIWLWAVALPWAIVHWQPVTAFVSASIAVAAILKNQDVNRRRATIDLIEKSESSEHYRTILTTFRNHLKAGQTEEQRAEISQSRDALILE